MTKGWRAVWGSVLAALLAAMAAGPCAAARWQEVGVASDDGNRIYVDLDSLKLVDGLRVARVLSVYPEPRVNDKGILMDRHLQLLAINCADGRGVSLRTIGFLKEKQVGISPETTDWRNKLKPLSPDSASQNGQHVICTALLPTDIPSGGGSGAPAGEIPPLGVPPAIVQSKLFTGSGIFVNRAGFVLTNAHVINGCKTITVKAFGAAPENGTVDAVDPKNDMALVRTRPGYGEPAQFRPEAKAAHLGESVGVIGYPLTGLLSSEPKATFGQISSVAGINNDYSLLQISAPVQPGNSGGPVLDESGLVIGVVVSQVSAAQLAKVGIVPQNVNFAIRGELAQIFMSAHQVRYGVGSPDRRLETEQIAAAGERSTALLLCTKP